MAEVLGIIASVAQLAEYAIKTVSAVSEALERMKNTPEILEGKIEHLSRLRDAAEEVRKNTTLHTKTIELQLIATIEKADSLYRVVGKITVQYTTGSFQRRFWKAIRKKGERTLSEAFESLEREKLSLLLCISFASAEKVFNIDRDMNKLTQSNEGSKTMLEDKQNRENNPKEQVNRTTTYDGIFQAAQLQHEAKIKTDNNDISSNHTESTHAQSNSNDNTQSHSNPNKNVDTYKEQYTKDSALSFRGHDEDGIIADFGDFYTSGNATSYEGRIGGGNNTQRQPSSLSFGTSTTTNNSTS